jgi:DNA polymerase
VVKCRPPGNRDPLPEEAAACLPFLYKQIGALKPTVILAAGRVAAHRLLGTEEALGRLRGKFFSFALPDAGREEGAAGTAEIPLAVTYHPSALLRDESLKGPAFEDLKLLMARLVSLDGTYREEARPLLAKYALRDARFAALVKDALEGSRV